MTPAQLWMLRQACHGPVPYSTFSKWDQRPLAGLYKRGYISASMSKGTVWLESTQAGWDIYKMTTHGKLRKDPTAPVFRVLREKRGISTRLASLTERTKAV